MPGHPYKFYDKSRIAPRVLHDFYPTPRVAVDQLLKHMEIKGLVWEPASGNGAISRVLEEVDGVTVRSSDIQEKAYGEGGIDFLKSNDEVDVIITNPPYALLNQFMEHALRIARHKVAFLVNIHAVYGVARHAFYERHPPSMILALSRGIPFFKEGKWKTSGGVKHCWVVFDKTVPNTGTKLVWALSTGKAITEYDRELTKPDAECVPVASEPEVKT